MCHNYKKCPQNALHDAADVGPSGNPRDGAPPMWKDDLEARFALVDRVEEAGPINPHPRASGPSKTWFL